MIEKENSKLDISKRFKFKNTIIISTSIICHLYANKGLQWRELRTIQYISTAQ